MPTESSSRVRRTPRFSAVSAVFLGVLGASLPVQAQEPVPAVPVSPSAPATPPVPPEANRPAPLPSPTQAEVVAASAEAQTDAAPAKAAEPEAKKSEGLPFKHFFDHIKVGGYAQIRYNQLGQTNPRLVNVQGDRSIGGTGGFFFRRLRLILQGDIHPLVQLYFQTDFASSVSTTSLHFGQIRDFYVDIAEPSKQFRLRIGQSKVPFGFENLQSSRNRLPLDRSDALNSAVANERDFGVFLYWAPTETRKLFKELVDDGLKGSGDYGVVGIGVYNGQTPNRPEMNQNKHVVARVSYPFEIGGQIIEIGGGGYTGKFVITKDSNVAGETEFRDSRAYGSIILYPKPFGLQVEYNVGIGPEFHAFPEENENEQIGEVRKREKLHGGYALASLKLGDFIPYVRGVLYKGGKKHETNSPRYDVKELEMGVEWSPIKETELTAAYTIADRTYSAFPYEQESGRLIRLQLQVNY